MYYTNNFIKLLYLKYFFNKLIFHIYSLSMLTIWYIYFKYIINIILYKIAWVKSTKSHESWVTKKSFFDFIKTTFIFSVFLHFYSFLRSAFSKKFLKSHIFFLLMTHAIWYFLLMWFLYNKYWLKLLKYNIFNTLLIMYF